MNAHLFWSCLLGAVVGYFCGSINSAALFARARGVNLSSSGSGNPGATNAGRVMGRGVGIAVLIFDMLKGLIPVLVFGWWAGPTAAVVTGIAAVIGHMTSPFLHFKGGKGVATTLGVVIGVHPIWLIPMLVCFAIVFVLTRRTGIASVAGALGLIASAIIFHPTVPLLIFGVVIGVLIIIRHHANIAMFWRSLTNDSSSTTT